MQRRREFATGRACARRALDRLGLPTGAIPVGARGEPLWPDGIVGSITHCRGYRACAVARDTDLAAIGIDAEPDAPLRERVLAAVAVPEELPGLERLAILDPDTSWDRLLFCAKESVYKAWFPLTGRRLGFGDTAVAFDPDSARFSVRWAAPGPRSAGRGGPPPACDREPDELSGRWLARDGLLTAAVTLAADGR
jgi:4'-phosphopantetheinyl transferase EntD